MTAVVVTLFEGDYVQGVGALVNSLVRNGFKGRVYAGYRGALTGWASEVACAADGSGAYRVAEDVELRFVPVFGTRHFTNVKPQFMLDVWNESEPGADAVFYFDPDIVVTCGWSFFEGWVQGGVAICQEVTMSPMPEDHPIRLFWRDWAEKGGWPTVRPGDAAFNAGFVGVCRADASALELWRDLIERIGQTTDLVGFLPGDRSEPFHVPDQDALNILTMVYPGGLSRIGPEGMGFVPGGFTMLHAAGGVKAWRKRFVRSALGGIPPTGADKGWFANADGPIPVVSPFKHRALGIGLRMAAALGRFIKRA